MKKGYLFVLALGLLSVPSLASAEMISGTITGIDPVSRKVTVLRSDNNDSVTISVKDQSDLSQLRTGNSVTLDANRRFFGGWEAKSIEVSGAAASAADAELNRELERAEGASADRSASDFEASASAVPSAAESSSVSSRGEAADATSVETSSSIDARSGSNSVAGTSMDRSSSITSGAAPSAGPGSMTSTGSDLTSGSSSAEANADVSGSNRV